MVENELREELLNDEESQKALKDEDENILLWATLGIAYGIDIFVTKIEREVALLRNAGVGTGAISDILRADLANNGRIFGEYRNTIKRGIVSSIMQSSRVGQDSVHGDRIERFKWISVGSPKICPDCELRDGQLATWKEWEAIGFPASGFSVCKEFCYCVLVPESVEIDQQVIL